MKVTLEKEKENVVKLDITIPAKDAADAYNNAVRKISQYVNIDGFRKGKAPRSVVERHVGTERIKQEAMERLMPKAISDAIIENNQAIEMADLYRGILSSTTDTVATIISNNLNTIMKFLAGITIVFSIPTMVASFMGMNVTFGKFADNPYAFMLLLLVSLLLSLVVALILKKKNML